MNSVETYLRSLLSPYAFDKENDSMSVALTKPFSEYLSIDSMAVLNIIASIEENYDIDIATPLSNMQIDQVSLDSLTSLIGQQP